MQTDFYLQRVLSAFPARLSTKIWWIIPFAAVFCTSNLTAQSNAFSVVSAYTGLDASQTKVVNAANSSLHTGGLNYIGWASGDVVGSDGKITVTLAGENSGQPIVFDVVDTYSASETQYAVFGKSSLGEIALYVTPEGKGGSITLGSAAYTLYPLGGNRGVFVKGSKGSAETGACATNEATTLHPPYCSWDCGKSVVDVLAMVTPGAQQWLDNNYGLFGLWFLFQETVNINGALANSAVAGKKVRVQIISYTPNFALTTNPGTDISNLSNNLNAQQTLQQSGADVGILLTNQSYVSGFFTVFGVANSLDPTSTNKFCIAEIPFIDPIRYTFAHELAHQFGCMHSSAGGTDCPHGKNMVNGRNTIMADGAANNSRIQHFSNPDVFFAGESTGTVNNRNNAAQLRGAFCEVANNNNPTYFTVDYDHTPVTQIGELCPFFASANVDPGYQEINGFLWNCGTSYTYQWAWSTNNTSWTNFGPNSPTLNLSATPSCPLFWLRLTVTTPVGCNKTYKKLFTCNNFPCGDRDFTEENDENTLRIIPSHRVVPNPATNRIEVMLEDFADIKSVTAVTGQGSASSGLKMLDFTKGLLTCDVSELPAGIWFLHVKGTEKSTVLKFVIAR